MKVEIKHKELGTDPLICWGQIPLRKYLYVARSLFRLRWVFNRWCSNYDRNQGILFKEALYDQGHPVGHIEGYVACTGRM